MQAERKWHILLSIIIMLITSSQCMDSKEAKLKERRTLLDLILQVIGDNQRDKLASRRITSGLFSVPQDLKFSSREKSSYFPKQDRSRPIGCPKRHKPERQVHKSFYRTSEVLIRMQNTLSETLLQYKGLLKTSILQKMCKIANAASIESALYTVISVAWLILHKHKSELVLSTQTDTVPCKKFKTDGRRDWFFSKEVPSDANI